VICFGVRGASAEAVDIFPSRRTMARWAPLLLRFHDLKFVDSQLPLRDAAPSASRWYASSWMTLIPRQPQ
jgi:hypothetical protein